MLIRLLSPRLLPYTVLYESLTKAYVGAGFSIVHHLASYRGKSSKILCNPTNIRANQLNISKCMSSNSEEPTENEENAGVKALGPKTYTDEEIQAIMDGSLGREVHRKGTEVKKVPVAVSIQYVGSRAFHETYGDGPVWKRYRRNHKGHAAPKLTRRTCLRKDILTTSNPCPICRDDFLVVHHTNVKLLHHFISEYSGNIITFSKTGVCQREHMQLRSAIYKAQDLGLIKYDVPFRKYDYANYYPELKEPQKSNT